MPKGGVAVSLTGVGVPFALGALFAVATFSSGTFFTPTVSIWQGALFFGAAMSITAFPMLARIIKEKGLAGSSVGVLALAAGAFDDAVAWCALALVLSCFKNDLSICASHRWLELLCTGRLERPDATVSRSGGTR
jgi:Kef-type K+ transport system membrane component KefB